MVLALWLADAFYRQLSSHQRRLHIAVEASLLGIVMLLCLWQAGLFTVSIGSLSGTGGYGYYRMNLLSLVDSSGWSYVLPDLPQGGGDDEGFNYLGLGHYLLYS